MLPAQSNLITGVCRTSLAQPNIMSCAEHGLCLLTGVNVADLMLDMATGEVASSSGLSGADAIKAAYTSYEQFAMTADDGFHDSTQLQQLRLVDSGEVASAGQGDAEAADVSSSSGKGSAMAEPAGSGFSGRLKRCGGLGNRGGAGYTTQLRVLLSRCIKVCIKIMSCLLSMLQLVHMLPVERDCLSENISGVWHR